MSVRPPHHGRPCRSRRGFALIELLVTTVIGCFILGTVIAILMATERSLKSSSNQFEVTQSVRSALEMIAKDLKAAGYGADIDGGQPRIAYVDSVQVLICANLLPYPDTTATPGAPLAYNPSSNPKPWPLSGTSWTPPKKYLTGAEIIRWTLDANNDGSLSAADAAASGSTVADHTNSPDDLVLLREVYGDSTGNAAGSNGPTIDQVAAIVNPNNNGVPRMFKVYLGDNTTPWNWGSGPVPVAELHNIKRIEVTLVATSGKKRPTGQHPQASMSTTVWVSRSTD